jgi:hypothetical protein
MLIRDQKNRNKNASNINEINSSLLDVKFIKTYLFKKLNLIDNPESINKIKEYKEL